MAAPLPTPDDIWNSVEIWKTVVPIVCALIAVSGVAASLRWARVQFITTEKRIENHLRNGDASKARMSVRQTELLRLKDEVALAGAAVKKLVDSVINSNTDTDIVKSTAAAFQDVAPIFKTMSTVKSNWSLQPEEIAALVAFEDTLTKFFIRLDFAPSPDGKPHHRGTLKGYAKQVDEAGNQALEVLRSSWDANSRLADGGPG